MLDTVENAVARMNKVLTQLRRGSDEALVKSVALADILADAAASKQAFSCVPRWRCHPLVCACAPSANGSPAPSPFAAKCAGSHPASGQVALRGFEESGQAIVEITDTGSGMDDEFVRTRLFQPFDSTKGAGMGIGAYECRETLRALGGTIEVDSMPGSGTRFRLSLPLDNNSSPGGEAA